MKHKCRLHKQSPAVFISNGSKGVFLTVEFDIKKTLGEIIFEWPRKRRVWAYFNCNRFMVEPLIFSNSESFKQTFNKKSAELLNLVVSFAHILVESLVKLLY